MADLTSSFRVLENLERRLEVLEAENLTLKKRLCGEEPGLYAQQTDYDNKCNYKPVANTQHNYYQSPSFPLTSVDRNYQHNRTDTLPWPFDLNQINYYGEPAAVPPARTTFPECNAPELLANTAPPIDDKPFKCKVCQKAFAQQSSVDGHMRVHSGGKCDDTDGKITCNVCFKSFKSFGRKRHFNEHMRKHLDAKPYKCDECGKAFANNRYYRVHLKVHKTGNPFACHACGKSFSIKANYRAHLMYHTNERPFKCGICDKAFTRNDLLKAHLSKHNGEKPYKCEPCDEAFATQHFFLLHNVNVHGKKIETHCTYCDRLFLSKSTLAIHLRKHTGERPFRCKKCALSFASKSILAAHVKVHVKRKSQYECADCDAVFTRVSSLTKHTGRYHAGAMPYTCDLCGDTFSYKLLIRNHHEKRQCPMRVGYSDEKKKCIF